MVGGRNFHQSHSVTNRKTVTSSSNSASSNSPQLTTSIAVTNSTRASNSNHNLSTTNLTLDRDHETVHHHHHHQQQHQHQHPPPLPPHHSSSSSLSTNNNIRSRYSKSFVNLNNKSSNNSHSNNGNGSRTTGEASNSVTTRQYSSTSTTSNRITRSIPSHNINSSTSSTSSPSVTPTASTSDKQDIGVNRANDVINTLNNRSSSGLSDREVGSVDYNNPGRAKLSSGIPKRIDQQSTTSTPTPSPISQTLSRSFSQQILPSSSSTLLNNQQQQPESAPLFPDTPELRPEIFFLLKEHAKTLAALSKITNKLGELENKVEEIVKKVVRIEKVTQSHSQSVLKKNEQQLHQQASGSGVSCTTTAITSPANILSDDSGGEYSRTTTGTGTDEDELLSLLNQIAKFSDTIKQSHSSNANIYAPLISSSRSNHRPFNNNIEASATVYAVGTGSTGSSTGGTTTLRQTPQQSPNKSAHHTLTGKRPISPLSEDPRIAGLDGALASQSFSALLFESNLDHFLDNLDLMTEPVQNSGFYPPPPLFHPLDHHHNQHQSYHQLPQHQQLLHQQHLYNHLNQHGRSLPDHMSRHLLTETGDYLHQQQQQIQHQLHHSQIQQQKQQQSTCGETKDSKSSEHWSNRLLSPATVFSNSPKSPSSSSPLPSNHVERSNRTILKPSSHSEIPKLKNRMHF